MIEMAKIKVKGTDAKGSNAKKIPKGLMGGYITVEYDDPLWSQLRKTIVFQGSKTVDVISESSTVVIPTEVLQETGKRVYVGFYGASESGKTIIPTFWVEIGVVVEATYPMGDEAADPTLPIWAQLSSEWEDLKKSGFVGPPGKDGKDGYTPQKGIDYFDGKDGTPATHSWSGTVLTITSASGTSSADLKGEPGKDGYTPQKNVDYFDGKDGQNGNDGYTPVKGIDYFDGDPGPAGSPGLPGRDGVDGKTPVKGVDYFDGADGKTPVKGVDYYTDADKQEIISEVLDQIEIPEGSGGSAELPVFDLAAMGLAAVTLPTGLSAIQTDTSALLAALAAGSVKFIIPVSMSGATINVQVNMQGFTDGATVYQCSTLFVLEATFALFVTANAQGIQVMIMPAATAVGFPAATAADNGKIMEVVNGSWTAVEVKDSSVATYVDDYISSALEGDY